MRYTILWSLLISISIILGSISVGYIAEYYWDWGKGWDFESARYVFSAVAQSLAAIFALAFVILNFITFFASKSLAKHVYYYVFSLKRTWITYFLFIFIILLNFIYLAYIKYNNSIINYPYAILANLPLYISSMIFLGWYAYTTYNVSIEPFDSFYGQVYKAIPLGLKSLKELLDQRILLEEFIKRKDLSFTLDWVVDGKRGIIHNGKEGYVNAIDIIALRMAVYLINSEQRGDNTLYYLVSVGDKIHKNRFTFAFDPGSDEVDQRVEKLLADAIKIKKDRPGWTSSFSYLSPLFDILRDDIKNMTSLKYATAKLKELAEYYVENRDKIIKGYDLILPNYKHKEFIDDWFEEYAKLIKQACIAKSQMNKEGKILEREDEPDFYVIATLHQIVSFLYKWDQAYYFDKALLGFYKYSVFLSPEDESRQRINYFNNLKYVLKNLSYAATIDLKESKPLYKYNKYAVIVITEYLNNLKYFITFSNIRVTRTEFNRLRDYLIDKIEDKAKYDHDLKVVRDIRVFLFTGLHSLSTYALSKVYVENHPDEIFIKTHNMFWTEYIDHGEINSIQIEDIFAKSSEWMDEIGWFRNIFDEDEKYASPNTVPNTLDRTDEYSYYTFILTLCRFIDRAKLNSPFWTLENRHTLNHFYQNFKQEVLKPKSKLHNLFFIITGRDMNKFNQTLEKLDELIKVEALA